MTHTILVVDDDPNQRRIAEHVIGKKLQYEVMTANGGKEAIAILTSDQAEKIDLVLLDLAMPEVSGMDVLNALKSFKNRPPIVVRTAYDDIDLAVDAMKAGAIDFVKKQDGIQRLQTCISNALKIHALNNELLRLKRTIGSDVTFADIIGSSPAIKQTIALGKKAADSDIPVFIGGESGVGKELLARAIHNASERHGKPFIAVNCGAIPENLVESILFGHEKGAFTGAINRSVGKFREADGGTLFLDEVGELSANVQVKLLRALQEGEIESVGGKQPIKVNIRIISATNKDLTQNLGQDAFREDLYYRLHVFPIMVPPLSVRAEDIVLMVNHFFKRFAAAEEKDISNISDSAMKLLTGYSWPGNVRELKNTIFRAVVLCDSTTLDLEHFPQIANKLAMKHIETSVADERSSVHVDEKLVSAVDNSGHFRSLCEVEQEIIASAYKFYRGHMSEIARRLGIGRSTLYRKLQELGIQNDASTPD